MTIINALRHFALLISVSFWATLATAADEPAWQQAKQLIYQALESQDRNHPGWVRAREIVEPLAAEGDPAGKYFISFLYSDGRAGYPRDSEKAQALIREAADEGFVDAMMSRAISYHYGLHEERNAEKAVDWYVKAAEAGSGMAASILASAYEKGQLGLAVDQGEAQRWRDVAGACEQ